MAEERDIDTICNIIKTAVEKMGKTADISVDDIYPAKEDFLEDGQKRRLFVGLLEDDNNWILLRYQKNKRAFT